MTPVEIHHTATLEVKCDGGGGTLGHPRVFLHIDPDVGEIACPYCSRLYRLKAATPVAKPALGSAQQA